MKQWLKKFEHYWFAEAPAARLAVLRILVGAFALQYVGVRYEMFVKMAGTDESLFAPVGVAAFLSRPIEVWLFEAIMIATLLANAAFILGYRHRYTGPLFAGLLLWLLCYRNSWSMIFHSDNAMVMHVLILGLAASADAYSLDARRRARRSDSSAQPSSWRYGWPLRLMCAVAVATYFVAGVAKLASHGLSWGSGESLRGQIAVDGLRKELLGDSAGPMTYALYDEVWLFTLLGVGTLVLELGAPLAMAGRRLGQFWAVNVWLMHWGIFFIMGITFRYQMAGLIFLAFFRVERIAEGLRSRIPAALPAFFQRFNPRIAHLIAAAFLCGAFLLSNQAAAQTVSPDRLQSETERPSPKTREYVKLRQEALKDYNDPKKKSFKEDVDEAFRQKQREHSEYALAVNLGDAADPQVSRTKDKLKVEDALYDNLLVQEYVNRLGQSLIPKESKRLYAFKVIYNAFPEARSLSTGTIYISTGLLSLVDNEAQLAYLLAHEIAHVEKNHWFDDVMIDHLVDRKKSRLKKIHSIIRYTTFNMSRTFSGWTGADQVFFRVYSRYGLQPLLKVFSPKILTSWDQIHEDEADRLALDYMFRRNYDPREAGSFYANLYGASKAEANLQFGFTATEQRIGERARAVNFQAGSMSAAIASKPLQTGAIDLAALKQKNPELAAWQDSARKQLAYFISGPGGPGKSFGLARGDTPALGPALESELRKKLEKGLLIAGAPEFSSLMAVVKRDNGFRAYQSDLFRIARVNLAEALLLRSDDPLAHYYKGRVWMQSARESADKSVAIEAFRRAVHLDTTNSLPEPRLHLALALMDGGRPSARTETASLLKDYVRIYKARHQGSPPPDADTISEYLRNTNPKEAMAQTEAAAVKSPETDRPQAKPASLPIAQPQAPNPIPKRTQTSLKPKKRRG
jgi:predicted Zn-dependent protease